MKNSSKTWDFNELNKLCAAKHLPESKAYQKALAWKRKQASYHAEKYHEIWKGIFSSPKTIQVGGQEWNKAQFESETHVEAAVQVLHSMVDVLAQIINKVVLRDYFKEGKVSLNNVIKEMEKQNNAPNILKNLMELKDSSEFKYIDAFVNTIKHRRLLKNVFHAEGGENKRNEHSVCFLEFEYKGNNYPFTWAIDIIGPYENRLFELITETGNSVNDYLR